MKARDLLESGELVWFHERGVGYVDPAGGYVYGLDYFEEYERRKKLEASPTLMAARREFVRKYHDGPVLDVGAGACAFVDHMNDLDEEDTFGYDVNPYTVHTLIAAGGFHDPFEKGPVAALTFWDVLEHFQDPAPILSFARKFAFISIPIFDGPAHARSSKHFKPREHVWYWTEKGLVRFMCREGFELLEISRFEEAVGREGIGSYAFARRSE